MIAGVTVATEGIAGTVVSGCGETDLSCTVRVPTAYITTNAFGKRPGYLTAWISIGAVNAVTASRQ